MPLSTDKKRLIHIKNLRAWWSLEVLQVKPRTCLAVKRAIFKHLAEACPPASGIRARANRVAHQQMTSLSQAYICKHTKMPLACTWKHAKARPKRAHGNMRTRVTVVRMHNAHMTCFRSESEPTATPRARPQCHCALQARTNTLNPSQPLS